MGYWLEIDGWKEIKCGGFYVPPDYPSDKYKYRVELYPSKDLLVLEEKGNYYDDHAIIKFTVQTIAEARYIVNHCISIKTV